MQLILAISAVLAFIGSALWGTAGNEMGAAIGVSVAIILALCAAIERRPTI